MSAIAQEEQQIREWFKDHRVLVEEFGPQDPTQPWQHRIGRLHWRQPGSQICSITYIATGGYLVVLGDLGEAVYQWSEVVTFSWLAGLEFGYMQSKCQASPDGRRQVRWSSDAAMEKIRQRLTEDKPRLNRVLKAISDSGCLDNNEYEWWKWLENEGSEESLLGPDDQSYWGDVGMIPTIHSRAHLIGLKMAVDQLKGAGLL